MLEADFMTTFKRVCLRLVCRVIYFTGVYWLLKTLFHSSGVYIFFYHNIVDSEYYKQRGRPIPLNAVDKKALDRQLAYYKKDYTLISLDEAEALLKNTGVLDKKYLVITFDDGYRDNYLFGQELFEKYSVKPTLYLTANNVDRGTCLWPDLLRSIIYTTSENAVAVNTPSGRLQATLRCKQDKIRFLEAMTSALKTLDEEKKYKVLGQLSKSLKVTIAGTCDTMLNWAEVRALSMGGAVIGAHTLNHPILANLSKRAAEIEIVGSKALIEARTERPVLHFAYPNGKAKDMDDASVRCVRKCFKTAVTTMPGINKPGADLARLKRIGLAYDVGIVELKVKVLCFSILDKFGRLP